MLGTKSLRKRRRRTSSSVGSVRRPDNVFRTYFRSLSIDSCVRDPFALSSTCSNSRRSEISGKNRRQDILEIRWSGWGMGEKFDHPVTLQTPLRLRLTPGYGPTALRVRGGFENVTRSRCGGERGSTRFRHGQPGSGGV